jgi:hypothetical protein
VVTEVPTTSGDALRLAIKLAVAASEYERAATILDILRRTTPAATVTPIGAAHGATGGLEISVNDTS